MCAIELKKKVSNSEIIERIDKTWYSDSVIANEMIFKFLNIQELVNH